MMRRMVLWGKSLTGLHRCAQKTKLALLSQSELLLRFALYATYLFSTSHSNIFAISNFPKVNSRTRIYFTILSLSQFHDVGAPTPLNKKKPLACHCETLCSEPKLSTGNV